MPNLTTRLLSLGAGLLSAWLLAWPASAESTRIMAMGDTVTAGAEGFASYRYDLWFMLGDAGYDVDFVGTQDIAVHTPNLEEYPLLFTSYDGDHEGYHQTRASEVAGLAAASIEAEPPDILLLMAGRADIYFDGATGVQSAAGFLSLIIDIARSVNPAVIVLLGQYPPDTLDNNSLIPNFNTQIAELAAEKSMPASPVFAVDHYTGFDKGTMLWPPGFPPNRAGEMLMAGRWFSTLETVLPEPTGGTNFQINAGLNDAWYNPDTPGQGFFFNVFPDLGLMFVAWFTYDTERPAEGVNAVLGEPGHRWVTGIGPYDGDTANIVLELTEGGVFDSGEPLVMQTQGYGTLELTFQDCSNATATYSIPAAGVSGAIPVQRIVSDNVPLCQSLADDPLSR